MLLRINTIKDNNTAFQTEMDPDLQARLNESQSQTKEKAAYNKFKTLITQCSTSGQAGVRNRELLIEVIRKFYAIDEPTIAWETMSAKWDTASIRDIKQTALELCGESINRDMIQYISTGIRGNFGPSLFNIINKRLM